MRAFFRVGYAFIAAAALLAGCNNHSNLQAIPGVAAQDGARSWMSADAASSDLMYVTNLTAAQVNVYSYPKVAPMGTLTGMGVPHGMCTDKAGDVFVIAGGDAGTSIVEFAHGGTTPLRTLADPGYFAQSCAVDPMTGTLAVTNSSRNFSQMPPGPGSVALYAHGKGRPTIVTDKSDLYTYSYDAYDNKGNLYVDGMNFKNQIFEFAVIRAGTKKFINITLNSTLNIPGGVLWDGQYLAVGNQNIYGPDEVYRFSIHGRIGVTEGYVPLTGSCDTIQFALMNGTLIAPNDCNKSVKFWKYPGGGPAMRSIPVNQPIAVVISTAAH